MMDYDVNAPQLLLLLCVFCVSEVWISEAPLNVVVPFSPSPPLLLSILTWSMISAGLLPPPVPSHGTGSPAASLVSFLVLAQYSRQRSGPAPLTQARQPGSRSLLLRLSTEAWLCLLLCL